MTTAEAIEKALVLPWNLTEHQVNRIAALVLLAFGDGMEQAEMHLDPTVVVERIRAEAAKLERGELR